MPSTQQLAEAEVELYDMPNREYRLRDALAPLHEHYDYILLDCPPALGNITINALTTANAVIVPMQCEFYSLEGVQQLTNTVDAIRKTWNPTLDIMGVLLTMYDKRNSLTRASRKRFAIPSGNAPLKR